MENESIKYALRGNSWSDGATTGYWWYTGIGTLWTRKKSDRALFINRVTAYTACTTHWDEAMVVRVRVKNKPAVDVFNTPRADVTVESIEKRLAILEEQVARMHWNS